MKPAAKISGVVIAIVAICAIVALAFAGGEKQPKHGNFLPATTKFLLRIGKEKKVSARIALTDLERSRGLMNCAALGDNEGMLFVYRSDEPRAFWMKNVPINLSIGFFDAAGKLLETHEMRAGVTTNTYSRADNIRYCLEMNAGWFEKNGFSENGRVCGEVFMNLRDVGAAMRARGFSLPEE